LNKLKISFLGTGIEIKRILVPEDVLKRWKGIIQSKRTLVDALLDPFFFFQLKDKKYTSLEDLPAEQCTGILNFPKCQIEFWLNKKKVHKLNTHEIFNESVLFPLFNTEKTTKSFIETKGLYIIQHEIGTVGNYELAVNSEKMNFDDFTFEIDNCKEYNFVKSIKFQNQDLAFVKKDTMITYQTGFEIL
jgi:hypothetical protein